MRFAYRVSLAVLVLTVVLFIVAFLTTFILGCDSEPSEGVLAFCNPSLLRQNLSLLFGMVLIFEFAVTLILKKLQK